MEQIRRQRKGTERMGIAKRYTERDREQAGMSREGRRTMEKVLENTVRDKSARPSAPRFVLPYEFQFELYFLDVVLGTLGPSLCLTL